MKNKLFQMLVLAVIAIAGCSKDETPYDPTTGDSGGSVTTLADPAIAWSAESVSVTLGGDYTLPTLSNPHSLPITYSSSNTNVATVSAAGVINVIAAGTTTITASSAETSTYKSGSASFTLTVQDAGSTLEGADLSWPSTSYEATLGSEFTSPVLNNPHNLSVTYASSNTGVATIASDGTVTLVAAGTTTITATSEATSAYASGSAYYTLAVKSASDDGTESTSFPSAGDPSSDDDISNTSFTRLVTVTYSASGASVTGYSAIANTMTVTVSGNKVTINYSGTENVVYKLSGSASDGFFKLYSSKKQAIWLDGLSLTNSAGAAINNQSSKRTFIYLTGTNTLADGSSAAYSATGEEDMKAVLFSEGQLCISGSGSLTVNANNAKSKSGIVSDDYVRVMGSNPVLTINAGSSAGHGLRGKDYVQLSGGTLNITTKANMKKGIGSDNYVLVDGGTTTINVSGGVAYDSEDSEYKGTAGIKADNYFAMTGGTVNITNTGSGGKGLSAGSYDYDAINHTLSDSYISGGTLTIKTSGAESNSVSTKGLKIGYKYGSRSYVYAGNLNISGGTINVSSTKGEGIEAKGTLTITDGYVYGYSGYDDGINSQGDMTISGGYACAHTAGTQNGADGFDANGNIYVKGGVAYGICTKGNPDVAFDANSEGGKKLYVTGGSLISVGGLESGYSMTGSAYYTSSWTASTWYGLFNSSGNAILAFKTPASRASVSLIVYSAGSSVTLKSGVSYTGTAIFDGNACVPGTITGGSNVSLSTFTGSGGGGPGGGGPGRPW